MQRSSMAQDIRDAFLGARAEIDDELVRLSVVEQPLSGLTAERAVALVRQRIQAGPLWLVLVRSYRAGSRHALGPLLLEMLAPSLVAASIRLRPVPPVVTEDDIRQDLAVEALRVFAAGSLPRDPRWIPRHVTLRATQAVARRLAAEGRRQIRQVPLEGDDCPRLPEHVVTTGQPGRHHDDVRPCTHNVRRRGPRIGRSHVHMRSGAMMRERADQNGAPHEELMNTASNRLRPPREERGNS